MIGNEEETVSRIIIGQAVALGVIGVVLLVLTLFTIGYDIGHADSVTKINSIQCAECGTWYEVEMKEIESDEH